MPFLKKSQCLFAFFLFASFCVSTQSSNAQTYLEAYGQNRIQYRKFAWKVFETPNFRVYHYDRSGKELARYVAEQAEKDFKEIQQKTNENLGDKFNVILYNSYEDYRQSNVGRKNDAFQFRASASGSVDMIDDKLVVYATGIHTELSNQIKDGISQNILERKLLGGTLDKIAINSAKNNIPTWLQEGYVQYSATGWTEKTDKAWKALVEANGTKKFYPLTEINGKLAGQAFWKYVAEKYGKAEPKQLMGLMKSKGNMNKTLRAKYQLNVVQFFDSCMYFYNDAFVRDAQNKVLKNTNEALVKIKVPQDGSLIRNIRVSPRGADVAYVKWYKGEFKVCLKNTIGEQQASVILEGGEKNHNEMADPNYPLMAWSNTGYKLAILYKKGNGMRLRIYDATKGKLFTYVVPNNRFDRALGMAIDEDNNGIILSAIRKSQTDLFYFTTKGARMRNLTNDIWDDVQPAFVTGGQKRGIMFLSNRPKPNMNVPSEVNKLPTGPMNVYFYNTTTKSPNLFQCSDADENTIVTQPIQYGPDNFAYIADKNGVRNKYVVVFGRNQKNQDSAYWVPVTNLSHSLNSHQYNPAGDLVADVIEQDGNYNVYLSKLNIPEKNQPGVSVEKAILVEEEKDKIGIETISEVVKRSKRNFSNNDATNRPNNSSFHIPNGNTFQTEFSGNINSEISTPVAETTIQNDEEVIDSDEVTVNDSTFVKMKPQPYRVGFKANDFSVSLDNNLLFTRYQSASQNGNQFANPSLGGLITFSMDDMMEDYRFTGGFRLPFGNNGSTYFAQFDNAKRRLDWSAAVMRSANTQQYTLQFVDTASNAVFNTLGIGKTTTTLVQGSFSYPLDQMRSLRFQTGFRQDALYFKAIDTFSIIVPTERKYWSMSRLEFVYDNTKLITTNIRNGTRYKVFGEYMSQLNGNAGSVYNVGFDFRSYQKIYKNLIWAFRGAAAHSGGKQKILYFLGGVDNWLNYQQATPQAPVNQETYGFQTLANTLRGYKQNARNGNSYAVANSEFRFPILTSLVRRPIQSKILRSLQLVAFTDIGLAWNGLFPNDASMSKNQILSQAPVTVSINMPNTEGVALGYGLGMRMAVSGYQFRVDAAWNKEKIQKPIIYLSLGTDF